VREVSDGRTWAATDSNCRGLRAVVDCIHGIQKETKTEDESQAQESPKKEGGDEEGVASEESRSKEKAGAKKTQRAGQEPA
jgi:hypothetical protein